MRNFILLTCSLFLISCGTVTPKVKINMDEWVSFDHKTSYSVNEIDKETIYLTVKYGSYTFFDKSTELVPTAKSVFNTITKDLAKNIGKKYAIYIDDEFYQSVAYDGITGISTVLISNDVKFSDNKINEVQANVPENDSFLEKLNNLKRAYKEGLINEEEYDSKKKKLIDNY